MLHCVHFGGFTGAFSLKSAAEVKVKVKVATRKTKTMSRKKLKHSVDLRGTAEFGENSLWVCNPFTLSIVTVKTLIPAALGVDSHHKSVSTHNLYLLMRFIALFYSA